MKKSVVIAVVSAASLSLLAVNFQSSREEDQTIKFAPEPTTTTVPAVIVESVVEVVAPENAPPPPPAPVALAVVAPRHIHRKVAAKAVRHKHPAVKRRAVRSRSGASGSVWDRLAQCESGGNWGISTGNGYSGGVQFSNSTWRSVGGSGTAANASKEEQIARAKALQARSGWGQWPACSRRLGLR